MLWPEERVRIVHTTTTQVVPMPTVIEVAHVVSVPSDRSICPPPRSDAPRAQPEQPPEPVGYIRPSSTNAGWIAAWNDKHIYISMDAGASWQPAFEGNTEDIRDVDFDCHGRAIVVRGTQLGIREGAEERWHALPGLALENEHDDAWVIGGGPDVVVVGHAPGDEMKARLVISRDRGATWERRHLVGDYEGNRVIGRQYEDGRILAMVPLPDCMSTYPWVFEYKTGVVTHHHSEAASELVFDGDRIVSRTGWHRIGSETVHDYSGVASWPSVAEGPFVISEEIYRFRGGRLVATRWQVHDDATDLVGDRAGRLWYIACGKVAIASRTVPDGLCPDQGAGDSST